MEITDNIIHMAYDFLKNIQARLEILELNEKKRLLNNVVSSLSYPIKNVIFLCISKQINDVNELINKTYLKNKK